uniref:Uncharacterized protein n=1 Tax=viral metagenome TaxID=1070528 RepID=A0A6C0BPJ7_9ZZZZ
MPFDTESRISATDVKLFNSLSRREDGESSLRELEKLIGAELGPSGSPLGDDPGPSSPMGSLDASPMSSPAAKEPDSKSPESPSSEANADSPRRWQDTFGDTQYNQEDFADVDVEAENKDPRIRREKQEILFQLLKLFPEESKGQWTMQMPLFELKYELKRREEFQIEQEQIVFIKDVLKMIFVGIEYANRRFGPVLELDGWAEFITADMKKFDRCILALYRRYFRRSKMDPLMEFGWLLIGSMVMYHVQCKYLGGAPRPSSNPAADDIAPPPGGAQRFSFQQAKPKGGFNLNSLLNLFARGSGSGS